MKKILKTVDGWEVSILELKTRRGLLYKVTKRLPDFSIAETRTFWGKKEAIIQFNEWAGIR